MPRRRVIKKENTIPVPDHKSPRKSWPDLVKISRCCFKRM